MKLFARVATLASLLIGAFFFCATPKLALAITVPSNVSVQATVSGGCGSGPACTGGLECCSGSCASSCGGDGGFTLQISNVEVVGIGSDQATIAWCVNSTSSNTLNFGLDTSFGQTNPVTSGGPASCSGTDVGYSSALTGLAATTKYYYQILATTAPASPTYSATYDLDQNHQPVFFTTLAKAGPGNVTGLSAVAEDRQNVLAWVNPSDADLASIVVVACPTSDAPYLPSGPTDTTNGCAQVSNLAAVPSATDGFTHTGLINGTKQTYAVYARNTGGLYSSGATVSAAFQPPVLSFGATPGDGTVSLHWTNQVTLHLAGIRLIECTGRDPVGPLDTSAGCADVSDTVTTSFSANGLTNGTDYHFAAFAYSVYPGDPQQYFSAAALTTSTPTTIVTPPMCGNDVVDAGEACDNGNQNGVVCTPSYGGSCTYCSSQCTIVTLRGAFCGDTICNGSETAASCPQDCGTGTSVCGNDVVERGEACDTGSQNGVVCTPALGGSCTYCSASCTIVTVQGAVVPPTTTPTGEQIPTANLKVLVGSDNITLTPASSTYSFLPATSADFIVPTQGIPTQPSRGELTFGTQTYLFAQRIDAQGNAQWVANVPTAASPGSSPLAATFFFPDGTTQTILYTGAVQMGGLVTESVSGVRGPAAQAVVTLLVGSSGTSVWDGSPYGENNPQVTDASGSFGWYVPNGTYRVRVEKAGDSAVTTAAFTVTNNIAVARVDLNMPPNLPAVVAGVQQIRQNPVVQQSATISTPVVVAVAAVNVVSLLIAFNLLGYLQYLSTAPILLFSRRKRKGYGVVYNAFTKLPIDLAIVRLYRVNEADPTSIGQLVSSRVTDRGGRYFFLAPAGTYHVAVSKTDFTFPSAALANIKDDGIYLDVYHGEPIKVTEQSSIAANIPIEPPVRQDPPGRIVWLRRFRRTQNVVAVLGNIFAVGVFVVYPSVFTGVVALVQILIYALVRRLSAPVKPVSWGIVYDKQTGRPLSNVVARVFEPKYNKVLETAVTDSRGRYSFLLGPNEYYATFDKEGFSSQQIRPIDYSKKNGPTELSTRITLAPAGDAPTQTPETIASAPTPSVPPPPVVDQNVAAISDVAPTVPPSASSPTPPDPTKQP